MENDALLHKWINKTISTEELEVFKQRPEYGSLVELYEQTDVLSAPPMDADKMLSDILASPKSVVDTKSHDKPRSINFSSWMKYGIAASVLLVAGYFSGVLPSFDNNMVQYAIASNQQMEGTLPDKSTFVMSGDSKLYYDKEAWSTERKVSLEGEAFFKVEKGSKFSVVTPSGMVQVLGTEFSVISRGEKLAVVCKEGRVAVSSVASDNYKEVLLAGESMELSLEGISRTWKKDVTKLRKVTFREVTESLTKTYGVEWEAGKVDMSEVLTCSFKNDDLETALKTSLAPMRIGYKIVDGNRVVLGE